MILTDTSKFQKTQTDDSKVLTHLFQIENKTVELLKKLNEKHKISDKIYSDIPAESRSDILFFALYCQLLDSRNFRTVTLLKIRFYFVKNLKTINLI